MSDNIDLAALTNITAPADTDCVVILRDGAPAPFDLSLSLLAAKIAALLGLPTFGNAATRNVGTNANTVAAGDDSRITGALSAAVAATTYVTVAQMTAAIAAALNSMTPDHTITSNGIFITSGSTYITSVGA